MAHSTHLTDGIATGRNEATRPAIGLASSQAVLGVTMTTAAFAGIWAVMCLAAALAQSSGLREIGRGLVTALTGI